MKRFVRHVTPVMLLGFVLAACSGSQVPQEAPAAAAPALQAPSRPGPEAFRVEPALTVTTEKSARVYTGRGPWYLLVAEFPPGTQLGYAGSREGWLQVRTPDGETGWLAAADATLRDSRNQAVRYQIRPGRWAMEAESGLQITVTRAAAGVIQVSLSGLSGQPELLELREGNLLLAAPNAAWAVPSALDIGDSGVERISVSERGILVEVAGNPVHRVVQAEGDRVTVEFRPGLERLERTAAGWSLQARGDLRPALRQEEGELVLDLPGTLLAGGFPGAPDGIGLAQVEPEPARMPAGGLRLRLPAPKSPYALYRTGPGRLELRVLAPGLKGKTVLLDPGHGGEETGAVGVAGNLEKDLNLAVALLLQPMLEQAGARVLMPRTEDGRVLSPAVTATLKSFSERTQADLAARSAQANQAGADLVLSIHANAGPAGDGGTETFWAVANLNASRSRYLAELVQEELLGALGLTNRGVKQRPFNVIRFSEAPAVLVELGFMSNAAEERLLTSKEGQQASAAALFRAVRAYFEE